MPTAALPRRALNVRLAHWADALQLGDRVFMLSKLESGKIYWRAAYVVHTAPKVVTLRAPKRPGGPVRFWRESCRALGNEYLHMAQKRPDDSLACAGEDDEEDAIL